MWTKSLKLMLILGLSLFLVAGCGGDDDDPTDPSGGDDNNGNTGGSITATVDGNHVDFSENCVGAEGATSADRVLVGGDQVNESIAIGCPAAVGTHDLGGMGDISITIVYNGAAWVSESGSIIVTDSSDTNIEGTFSGSFHDFMQSSITVTDGTFDVPVVLAP